MSASRRACREGSVVAESSARRLARASSARSAPSPSAAGGIEAETDPSGGRDCRGVWDIRGASADDCYSRLRLSQSAHPPRDKMPVSLKDLVELLGDFGFDPALY